MDIAVCSLVKRLKIQQQLSVDAGLFASTPEVLDDRENEGEMTSSSGSDYSPAEGSTSSPAAVDVVPAVLYQYHTEDDDSGMASDDDDVIDAGEDMQIAGSLLTGSSGPLVHVPAAHSDVGSDTDTAAADEVYRQTITPSLVTSSMTSRSAAHATIGWCRFCLMQLFVGDSSLPPRCHGNGAAATDLMTVGSLQRQLAESELVFQRQYDARRRIAAPFKRFPVANQSMPDGYHGNRNVVQASHRCPPKIAISCSNVATCLRSDVAVDDEIREIFSGEDFAAELELMGERLAAGNTESWRRSDDVQTASSMQSDVDELRCGRTASMRRQRRQQEDINGNIVTKAATTMIACSTSASQQRPSLDLYKMRKLRIRRTPHRSFGRKLSPSSTLSSIRPRPLPITMSSSAVHHYLSKCLQQAAAHAASDVAVGEPAYCFRSLADSIRRR